MLKLMHWFVLSDIFLSDASIFDQLSIMIGNVMKEQQQNKFYMDNFSKDLLVRRG